jgi:hypothetical protein
MAPHAMVIKQNGNTLPATTGPEPSINWLMGASSNWQNEKDSQRECEDRAQFHEGTQ